MNSKGDEQQGQDLARNQIIEHLENKSKNFSRKEKEIQEKWCILWGLTWLHLYVSENEFVFYSSGSLQTINFTKCALKKSGCLQEKKLFTTQFICLYRLFFNDCGMASSN